MSEAKKGIHSPDVINPQKLDISLSELLESVVETSSLGFSYVKFKDGTVGIEPDFEILWANTACKQLLNQPVGKSIRKVLTSQSSSNFIDALIKIYERNIRTDEELFLSELEKTFRCTALKYKEGLILSLENISSQKDFEKIALENNEFLQAATRAIPVGMILAKAVRNKENEIENFLCTWSNQLALKELHVKQLAGEYFPKYLFDNNTVQLMTHFKEVVNASDKSEFENYNKLPDLWLKWTAVRVDDGVFISVENITFRKEIEMKQLESLTLLQQTEEISESGSWSYNISDKSFTWSEGMYRLFANAKSLTGKAALYIDNCINEDGAVARKLLDNIERGFEPMEMILRMEFDSGIKTFLIKMSPLSDHYGEIIKMLGVDRDITSKVEADQLISNLNIDLKKTNKQLESAQAEIRLFNELAAHKYTETLGHLYTGLEYLVINEAKNLTDSGRANIRRTQSTVQKLKLLTQDLQVYSRLQEMDHFHSDIDLNELIDNVVRDFQKTFSDFDILFKREHLPVVSGYPFLLSLCFHHLIDNAVKFRDKSRQQYIEVSSYVHTDGIMEDKLGKKASYYVVKISDNRIGFPPDESEKIFNMFYRLHEKGFHKGSGIGLSICKKVMSIHGGFIEARSIPGSTTSFMCYFPIS